MNQATFPRYKLWMRALLALWWLVLLPPLHPALGDHGRVLQTAQILQTLRRFSLSSGGLRGEGPQGRGLVADRKV